MNPITPLTTAQTQAEGVKEQADGYIKRVEVVIDIAANVITDGQQDETVSSRAARAALQGKWWGIALSTVLGWIQPNHGAKAQASDIARAENVIRIEESAGDLNK